MSSIARGVVEFLESKRLLSGEPAAYYEAITDEGSTYAFSLNAGDATIDEWQIDAGDGSAPIVVPGAATSFDHVYADGPLRHVPIVRAKLTNGTLVDVSLTSVRDDTAFGAGVGATGSVQLSGKAVDVVQLSDGRLVTLTKDDSDGQLVVHAADGTLLHTHALRTGTNWQALTRLANDDVVAVGDFYNGDGYEPLLQRIDPTTGSILFEGGVPGTQDFYNLVRDLQTITTPAGERIVAAASLELPGQAYPYATQYLVQFNTDLTLDATFGNGGLASIPSINRGQDAFAVAQQSDGKLLLAGDTGAGNYNAEATVTRFNADGTLDPTFGTNGTAEVSSGYGYNSARALLVEPDGNILVAHKYDTDTMRLRRLTSAGATAPIATYTFRADALAIDLVSRPAGFGSGDAGGVFVLAQRRTGSHLFAFSQDGALDDHVIPGGDLPLPGVLGGGATLHVDDAGALFVGIAEQLHRMTDQLRPVDVADVAPTINVDLPAQIEQGQPFTATFDIVDPGDDPLQTWAVDFGDTTIHGTGPLTSLGHTYAVAPATYNISVQLDNGDGSFKRNTARRLDPDFGDDGFKVLDFFFAADRGLQVLEQPDQKLLLLAERPQSLIVARLGTDGQLDPTFGNNGKVIFDGNSQPKLIAYFYKRTEIALTPTGHILIGAASIVDNQARGTVTRLTPAGDLDTTFGTDGQADLGGYDNTSGVDRLLVDQQGRIVTAIHYKQDGLQRTKISRLLADGQIDASFGTGGELVIDAATHGLDAIRIHRIAETSSGQLVLGGLADTGATEYVGLLIRLTPGGALDPSFGTAGVAVQTHEVVADFVIDRNDTIWATLETSFTVRESPLVRYTDAGQLDPTFGDNGRVIVPGVIGLDSLHLDDAGRLIAAGLFDSTAQHGAAVRYLPSGTLDPTFGDNGFPTVGPLGIRSTSTNSLVTQNGDIVFVGHERPVSGTYTNTLVYRMTATDELVVTATDAAPRVSEASFAFELGHAVSLRFSESIGQSLELADFALQNLTTGQPVPLDAATLTQSANQHEAHLTLSSLLPDGNYQLTLPAGSVTDVGGAAMTDDFTLHFYVLAGDANRDRVVDLADFVILRNHFGSAGLFSQGDFNYDGRVDLSDFVMLRNQFGKSLPGDDDNDRRWLL